MLDYSYINYSGVVDIQGSMILKDVLSCFKACYPSVHMTPRSVYTLDPLAYHLGLATLMHASRSKIHIKTKNKGRYRISSAAKSSDSYLPFWNPLLLALDSCICGRL